MLGVLSFCCQEGVQVQGQLSQQVPFPTYITLPCYNLPYLASTFPSTVPQVEVPCFALLIGLRIVLPKRLLLHYKRCLSPLCALIDFD